MRDLRVIEFLSIDGVMEAPEDWQRPYFDDVLAAETAKGMASTDAYLFGRRTYEKLAAYWPTAPEDDPYAGHLNATRKYVASTTLRELEWRNSSLIEGDVAEAVRRLKQEPGGDIAVLGSGELAQTLIRHDLVDEYFLCVFPIVLGSGKRLFRELDASRRLTLADSKATATGGVLLTYRPVS